MNNTIRLFITVVATLFCIEITIMLFLSEFAHTYGATATALIDSLLLSAIATPFIIRAIRRYISYNNELSILLKASQAISTTLDFDVALQTVIDNATRLFELHTGALYLLEGDQLYLAATMPELPPDFPDFLRHSPVDDHPHLKRAICDNTPVAVPDVSLVDLSPAESEVVAQRGLRSLLFLPLTIKNHVTGVLILGTTDKPRPFSQSEIFLYSTLANQAALVISNSRLYKEVQDHATHLEQRISQRTSELNQANLALQDEIREHKKTESVLIETKEAAERASEFKSRFLANMSHEIRTPMNAIIGMTHLALQTNLDATQRNYISKANRSAENLLGILNDILDFSKIEAGKLEFEEIDFCIDQVIDNMTNLVGLKASENGVQLETLIGSDVPKMLNGDPVRLGQILINLGSNAVKFSRPGGKVKLCIEIAEESANNVLLHFSVQDNGVGIPASQQAKLFQSFTQADSSTTRQYGGTGLGLAIAKRITQMMGGEIWFESEENGGSTFHFTARLKKQQPASGNSAPLHSVIPDANVSALARLSGSRILLVEDNEINQELVLLLLKTKGVNVSVAGNGQEALDMLEKETFDAVLMDCQMPVMDGYEATKNIRKQVHLKNLPIIALTANAMAGDREKVIEAGMNDHVTKPIKPDSLFMAIAKWLK